MILISAIAAFSQDTLVTYKQGNIPCKVVKITETEIEYRKKNDPEAPIYVINKDNVREIRFADGTKELIVPDEMDANKDRAIVDKRTAVKFNFFSPIMDQLTFSFERCIKVGTNVEASLGLINNSMFPFSVSNSNSWFEPNLTQGMVMSLGVKFMPGKSYYHKGMKYMHPLKGFYFKPEIMYSSFAVRGLTYTYWPNPYPSPPVTMNTDLNVNSVALMLTIGHQFIAANSVTIGGNVGFGYAMTTAKYTNPINQPGWWGLPEDPKDYTRNFFNHITSGELGPFAFSGNITLGYILK